ILSLQFQNIDLSLKGIVDPAAREQVARNNQRLNELYETQAQRTSSIREAQARLNNETNRAVTEQTQMTSVTNSTTQALEKQSSEIETLSNNTLKFANNIQLTAGVAAQLGRALATMNPTSER